MKSIVVPQKNPHFQTQYSGSNTTTENTFHTFYFTQIKPVGGYDETNF
ncbi:hypothetical protein [Mergibacter septicus]|nr:hypothetical protein [Mergibacter septicus]UTU48494.1 hypothetical protein HLL31_06860 [Mergibacter septicus]